MSLASIRRRIRALHKKRHVPTVTLSPEDLELKQRLEGSFHAFVQWSWHAIEAGDFVDNWHIESFCRHLELTAHFKIKNLIVNIPPGTMKSTILSMWNAWCWTWDPSLRFLCLSGSLNLAIKDSNRCKRIVEWDQYKKLWGNTVHLRRDENSKLRFATTAHGYRYTFSFGGNIRGEGGNFISIDDRPYARQSYPHGSLTVAHGV